MAITAFKVFISGEVLLASDLNSSFDVLVNEINVHGSELDTLNASPQGVAENFLINGDFEVWQRGTVFTNAGPTADLFSVDRNGVAASIARAEFTLGQTTVPGNPKYFHRASVSLSSANDEFVNVQHEIEGVTRFEGTGTQNQVTLSFWARADTTENVALELVQHFGTGGSPSSDVTANNVTTINLTTSWQKFTETFNLPTVSGKTLGTNGDDSLKILFWYTAGTDFDARTNALGHQGGVFEMAQVQLEAGSEATAFEKVAPAIQTNRAQQYYDPNRPGKNLIINGDFSVWQRGTGAFTADGYTADRWRVGQSGATTSTSQGTFALGQTDVPNNPKFYLDHDVTTSSDFSVLQHRVEDVTKTSEREVTLSFYAKGVDPSGGLVLRVQQNFGTGGSPSTTVTAETQTLTALTSSWQEYIITFTLPSISGKSLGTNNNDYLQILIGQNTDTGTTAWNIDIANVQLELGPKATAFEEVSPADQLSRCQRYFERLSGDGDEYPLSTSFAQTTTAVYVVFNYNTKRAKPTITYAGSAQAIDTSVTVIAGSLGGTLDAQLSASRCVWTRDAGTHTIGDIFLTRLNGASAIIDIDAEL